MTTAKYDIEPRVLRDWMVNYICGVLGMDSANFPTDARFDTYGLDSVEAVIMAGVMEEEFQVIVDPHQFFDSPSVDAFVSAFAAGTALT
jgi:acyl carrier protein